MPSRLKIMSLNPKDATAARNWKCNWPRENNWTFSLGGGDSFPLPLSISPKLANHGCLLARVHRRHHLALCYQWVLLHFLLYWFSSILERCHGFRYQMLDRLVDVIQNGVARLFTGTKKRDYNSPILASLHWLPIKYKVEFKTLLFVFKDTTEPAPTYCICIWSFPLPFHRHKPCLCSKFKVPGSKEKGIGPSLFLGPVFETHCHLASDAFKSRLKKQFFTLTFKSGWLDCPSSEWPI